MENIKELEERIEDRLEEIFEIRNELIKGLKGSGEEMLRIYSLEIAKCDAVYKELVDLIDYMNESFQ